MSTQCNDLAAMEMNNIIILSILCILLSVCFAFWLILCCTVLYSNKSNAKTSEERLIKTRYGSQGIALVNTILPIEETHESLMPIKPGTFPKAKGKEIQKALMETETNNQYENLAARTTLTSITHDTFGVNTKVSKVENEYGTNPTKNQEVDALNDKDDLPLVEKDQTFVEESKVHKPELTKKPSNPYHEITVVQGGVAVKEGIYDLLDKT